MSPGSGRGLPSMTTTSINDIGTVFVAVVDQDRALAFYRDVLGFELRADFTYAHGIRWIEVAPAGAANSIALVGPDEGRAAGTDQAICALATDDIGADHAFLRARCVDVDDEIASTGGSRRGLVSLTATVHDPVPAQFCFRDPDGNRFLIVQPG